jgi:hypothetical protein
LRRLAHPEKRLGGKIQHQVEAILARLFNALEIDGFDRTAGRHTRAMVSAAIEIDLEHVVDRILRARFSTRAAARAHVEIDRVRLLP